MQIKWITDHNVDRSLHASGISVPIARIIPSHFPHNPTRTFGEILSV
jgi:hypothetical protein